MCYKKSAGWSLISERRSDSINLQSPSHHSIPFCATSYSRRDHIVYIYIFTWSVDMPTLIEAQKKNPQGWLTFDRGCIAIKILMVRFRPRTGQSTNYSPTTRTPDINVRRRTRNTRRRMGALVLPTYVAILCLDNVRAHSKHNEGEEKMRKLIAMWVLKICNIECARGGGIETDIERGSRRESENLY